MSADQEQAWAVLAQMVRPQGRRGEVLAELMTDFPERLAGRDGLVMAPEGAEADGPKARPCRIRAAWLPKGRNEGRVVLEIEGVETIDAAEALSGWELLVRRDDRVGLEEDAVYLDELTGCRVFAGDREIGVVREVQFPLSADGRRRLDDAAPLLVVVAQGASADAETEWLVPFVREFVQELNVAERVLRMRLPEGLLELNEAG